MIIPGRNGKFSGNHRAQLVPWPGQKHHGDMNQNKENDQPRRDKVVASAITSASFGCDQIFLIDMWDFIGLRLLSPVRSAGGRRDVARSRGRGTMPLPRIVAQVWVALLPNRALRSGTV
jgi:hypothetical protein